jgi:hypothetical protein
MTVEMAVKVVVEGAASAPERNAGVGVTEADDVVQDQGVGMRIDNTSRRVRSRGWNNVYQVSGLQKPTNGCWGVGGSEGEGAVGDSRNVPVMRVTASMLG